eukprot:CAMPEP_0115005758 /NCGR_PEP_ID=MMETSP0216-20121206/20079_1 /TAXON_ID=223996 /ORGANISM="Protocruzia adherens, Strain Boccale" /LENGTH=433 /DNA_ID=CAMNT_0002372179 /DNA_START=937 /DNA_END=2239 /DNA_ORIENTATION=-
MEKLEGCWEKTGVAVDNKAGEKEIATEPERSEKNIARLLGSVVEAVENLLLKGADPSQIAYTVYTSNGCVGFGQVLKAKPVRDLTKDAALVIDAVNKTGSLVYDIVTNSVYPKPERNRLTLFAIPEKYEEKDVRELFEADQEQIKSIEKEGEGTWFVTIKSGQNLDAIMDKLDNKTIDGRHIDFSVQSAATPNYSMPMTLRYDIFSNQDRRRGGVRGRGGNPRYGTRGGLVGARRGGRGGPFRGNDRGGRGGYVDSRGAGRGGRARGGRGRGGIPSQTGGNLKYTAKTPKKVEESKSTNDTPKTFGKRVRLDSENFPSLDQAVAKKGGYEGEFIKYTKQEIITIFKNMKTIDMPEGLKKHAADVPVIKTEANKIIEIIAQTPKVTHKNPTVDPEVVDLGSSASPKVEAKSEPKEGNAKPATSGSILQAMSKGV